MPRPAFAPPPPPLPPPRRSSGTLKVLLIVGGCVAAVLVALGVMVTAIVAGARGKPAPVATLQVDRSAFPERPAMRRLARGVRFGEVQLSGSGPAQNMKLWLYLPDGQHAAGSLPCVFIAPAGSTLITGMALGDGDRAEHLPYVQEGFAVVSYELDGDVPGGLRGASNARFANAARQFMAAEGGISNAKMAIEYVLAKVPEVDPKRLYCAGHSSAATLALQLAAKEPRISACVAYAPATDIVARHGSLVVNDMERVAPGAERFLTDYSPVNLPTPQCPVFLFHAEDDSNVPCEQSKEYASTRGDRVKIVTVPTGDHYDSMIHSGIPAAIEWLKPLAGLPATPFDDPAVKARPLRVRPRPRLPGDTPSAE
jgi:acetyl esterase/lipase